MIGGGATGNDKGRAGGSPKSTPGLFSQSPATVAMLEMIHETYAVPRIALAELCSFAIQECVAEAMRAVPR